MSAEPGGGGTQDAATPTRFGGSLGAVLAGLFLALAAAGAVAAYTVHRRSAVDAWLLRLSAMASSQRAAVENYVEERTADAAVFASFPSVLPLVGPDGLVRERREVEHMREVLGVARAGWKSHSAAILGSDLKVRVLVGDDLPEETLAFLKERPELRKWVGFLPSPTGERVVIVAPVNGPRKGDRPAGWVVLVDDPAQVLWKIIRWEPVESRTGESFLVSLVGDRPKYISPLRHLAKGTRSEDSRLLQPSDSAARKALEEPESLGEFRDYRGVRVLAALRRIDATGWGLVVKLDEAEALEGLAALRAWAGLALLSLAAALLAVLRSIRAAERLRATDELRRVDQRHRLVLSRVRDTIVWVEPGSGRILEANHAAVGLWGYSREELLRMKVSDLRGPDGGGDGRSELSEDRRGGALSRTRHRRKDGSLVPVEVSARALDIDGKPVLVSVVRDVSENEAALERIQVLNRLLRTISAVDQVLVTARDRETVLRRTCEAIVSAGGFVLAWLAVPDGEGRLVPVASAGQADDYLGDVTVRYDDTPEGRGPTGTAFREGRTIVADDWEADATVSPWREAGRRRGFGSSAACPVRRGDAVSAVLTLYETQRHAFGPEAVRLLEELAGEVGLALELLDAREERRAAEVALAASEERYRKLFEENPAPMWVFDVETLRFLAVNEAAVILYGYSREEFLARSLRDIRPPEDVAAVERDVLVPRTGVRKSGPWRHQRKDGSVLLVEIVTSDVAFEGRNARLVLANDVTERLRAEEKLRAFFDAGMIGTHYADVDGRILAANDEYLRIVGYPREDLESGRLRWVDLTPPEWLPLDTDRIAEAKRRGFCTPYEKEYLRKDGTRVPVLVGYALVGDNREESVAFALDLTERKAAETALRRSEGRFTRFLDQLPAAAFVKDGASRVLWANRYLEELLGVGPLPGRTTHDAVRGTAGAVMVEDDRRALEGESIERIEELPAPDGDVRVYRTLKFPVPGREGEAWVGGFSIDVTEQVRAEEEVRRLNAELEHRVEQRTAELISKSRELEAFAYSISHDLRAPLRAIDGFSKMVEEDHAESLDGEGRRLLGVVRENSRRMGRLIDDLLAFSRAGRQDLRRSRVDVRDLVNAVLGEVLPEAERARSEVRVSDLPPVLADPALLRQVFVNLLSNAVKFTSTRPRRVIDVSGRRERGRVVYDVRDNGVGFDMRYSEKLFGVFQRLHGREFEGTGVGLALVERIVARHGGTVRAEAEPNLGALFTIAFPDEGSVE